MELMAEDDSPVTVQAITERADVGVGSFYYHFADKQEALTTATTEAFLTVAHEFVSRAGTTDDPVERFSLRVRLFILATDWHPVAARILVKKFPEPWSQWELSDSTIEPQGNAGVTTAVAELRQAVEFGGLVTPRPDFSILMVASGAVALMARRLQDPTVGAEAADDYTQTALVMLGMDPQAAHELSHRPIPPP